MYTIGQFSKICQVTAKALCHYEKIGLLIPADVDKVTQYRYYTDDQIALVKNIAFMKRLGIPLKTAKRMLRMLEGKKNLQPLIEQHQRFLLKQQELCSSRLAELDLWQKSLEVHNMNDNIIYDIRVRDVQETQVYSSRERLTSLPAELPKLIKSTTDQVVSHGEKCDGPAIILHHNEEYNPRNSDIEVCLPVTNHSLANRNLPAVKAVTCTHIGPYEDVPKAYQAIFKWINIHGFKVVYPIREIYRNDPRLTYQADLVTEIIVPIIIWSRAVPGHVCDDPYCVDPNCECQKKLELFIKSLTKYGSTLMQRSTFKAREKKFDLYMQEIGFKRVSDSPPYKWIRRDGTAEQAKHSAQD